MSNKEIKTEVSESRRSFIKKAAYAAPVIVTLAVAPTMHAYGSQNQSSGGTPPGGTPSTGDQG